MTGEQALDDALRQVEENADLDWKTEARRIVAELLAAGEPFTVDDVWDRLDRLDVSTHERRALGAILAGHSSAGRLRRVGQARSTRRRSTCTVWQPTENEHRQPADDDDRLVVRVGDLRDLFRASTADLDTAERLLDSVRRSAEILGDDAPAE